MSIFVCQTCGAKSPSWIGKCPECSEWNSYIEEAEVSKSSKRDKSTLKYSKQENAIPLSEISFSENDRTKTEISELDRVLGGGVVKGSVVLIAGEPGIGKSTLMLQIAASLTKNGKVLYVCGEESPAQIKLRSQRLSVNTDKLLLLPQTDVFEIEKQIELIKPGFIIVDSIQTISREDISSSPGSVSQVKECSLYLVDLAKKLNIATFIVGHVTKEGSVAGPRILEHMVDTVLYFEGDQHKQFRLIRTTKNRFGSTNEVGLFEMTSSGLSEVSDPSKILIDEISLGSPGSVVSCAIEGSRPLLVEIQALVSPSRLPSPRRVITGLDYNRCSIIMGVLERKAGIRLSEMDVYLNVASGIFIDEPAIDLPAACAIVSSYKNIGIDPKKIVIGEIGLTGEIRRVSNIDNRIKEAERLGFCQALVPSNNDPGKTKYKSIKLGEIRNIKEAINSLLHPEAQL